MSTATAIDPTLPLLGGHNHFLLRRLHSLTGIIFGGYLVVHLIVNATTRPARHRLSGSGQQNPLPPLAPAVEWAFIYLPILYHTVYGVWIFFTAMPNNAAYPYGKNWFYLFQRLSGLYIVLFLAFHVLSLKYGLMGKSLGFDPEHATRTIVEHLHFNPLISWIIYPLGVIASAYHTANGFWTAAITWGLTISAGAQRRWGGLCAGLFVLLVLAGMIALIAAATQSVS